MEKSEKNLETRGRPKIGRKNTLRGDWDQWAIAAEAAGKKTADWVREILDAAAEQELHRR